ncbi:MAG: Atu4866 domain-containing protein [Jiangellaceae bacterium]
MRANHEISLDTTVLGAASLLALALGTDPTAARAVTQPARTAKPLPPVGVWRTADGAVCLDIKTDGTYAGKVAGRSREAAGTYDLEGAGMTLRDHSGLHTPVTVLDGVLEMAGHRLGRA